MKEETKNILKYLLGLCGIILFFLAVVFFIMEYFGNELEIKTVEVIKELREYKNENMYIEYMGRNKIDKTQIEDIYTIKCEARLAPEGKSVFFFKIFRLGKIYVVEREYMVSKEKYETAKNYIGMNYKEFQKEILGINKYNQDKNLKTIFGRDKQ